MVYNINDPSNLAFLLLVNFVKSQSQNYQVDLEELMKMFFYLQSTVYDNPGEDEVREFREDYYGRTSDKETMRL